MVGNPVRSTRCARGNQLALRSETPGLGIDQIEHGDRTTCVLALGQFFGKASLFQGAQLRILLQGEIRVGCDSVLDFSPRRQRNASIARNR